MRGFFTAEVMQHLGFSENYYTVTGCPSIFMNGKSLKVKKIQLNDRKELNVLINGFRAWNNPNCGEYLKSHKNSIFVCQEEFYKLLYSDKNFDWIEFQYLNDLDNKWYSAYKNKQIKLYCDFPTWYNDLKDLNINFSFGARIHGNIVPILAGIPAYIDAFDSRVKELAEYFNIPFGNIREGFSDPWELYQKTDYTKFNLEFEKKYEVFENFMNDCGLTIDTSKPIHGFKNIPEQKNKNHIDNIVTNIQTSKKIVFVAHEFGLYKGHGGIASYLYNICKWLLTYTQHEVHVLAGCCDMECDLLEKTKFKLTALTGSLDEQRRSVYLYIKTLNPDYVEFAEYTALGLICVQKKFEHNEFSDTVLVTNNHTATKECYEWSSEKDFSTADLILKKVSADESQQMRYSDYCIAPSTFLAKYVQEHYGLSSDVLVFANPYCNKLENRFEIVRKLKERLDIEEYRNSFNIVLITRFEQRKHQERLVNSVIKLRQERLNIKLFLAGNTTYCDADNMDFRFKIYTDLTESQKEGIYFFDFLNLEQQENLIAIADLSVMPSTYENQPVAMVEMVLRRILVMGSIHSGIADYTKDNELLFNPFDENDLTNKIRNLYNLTQTERDNLSKSQYNSLIDFICGENSVLKRLELTNQ